MPLDNSDIGHTEQRGLLAERLAMDWEQFIPDIQHIDGEPVMLLRDGSLVAMLVHPGHAFELEELRVRNVRRAQYDQLWKNIADNNVTVATHLVHQRITPGPVAAGFTSQLGRPLFQSHRANYLGTQLFQNIWFLTVMVSPRFSPGRTLRRLFSRGNLGRTASASLLRQLEAIMQALAAYIAGARRLGYRYDANGVCYSEIAEARRHCIYGRFAPVPVVNGPLGAVMYNERIVCGSRAIRIDGFDGPRYARALAFSRYPSVTRTGQFAHVLDIKHDFVLAQTMRFASRSASETSIYLRQTQLGNIGRSTGGLAEAAEGVAAGEEIRGQHNFSWLVHEPDLASLDIAVGAVANAINNAGANPIHDDLNSFAAMWSTLPGNPEWLQARSGDIRTDNFSALSEFNTYPSGGTRGPWGRSLLQMKTAADTIFHWQPFVGEGANTLFLGPIRSGKTLTMNLLLCSLEQVGARVFYFDRDHCAEPMIRCAGGAYLTLRSGQASGLAPLRGLSDTPENRAFLVEWLHGLIQLDGRGKVKPETLKRLARGIARLLRLPVAERRLGGLRAFLGFDEGGDGERLDAWCHDGSTGWLFDGEQDELRTDARMVGTDMTELLAHPAAPAVASYILHRVRPEIDGRPIVVACPEARFYLTSPLFAGIIEDFALGLAKKNGALWLDTQEPQHLLDSPYGASLVAQCSSIFQFPTRTAKRSVYLDQLGFSPAMLRAITETMAVLPFRSVLLRREHESVILNVELPNMADEIAILSGTEQTIRLIPAIRAEVGDDSQAFRREFVRRAAALKQQRQED